jgi:hypothetical protein
MISENRLAVNRKNALKAGRKPGALNQRTVLLRDRIRRHEEVLVNRLLKIALFSESEANSLSAIGTLLDRGWGKPTQTIEGTGAALAIQIVTTIGTISDAVAVSDESGR